MSATFHVKSSEFLVRLAKCSKARPEDGLEDFLTESLAEAIRLDRALCQDLLALVACPQLSDIDLNKASIGIRTQVALERSSRLDLVLSVEGAEPIAVEVKLWSPEGQGQLAKYLGLKDVGWLAYLTPDNRKVDAVVLENPRYLRPSDRDHFVWHSLFHMVQHARAKSAAESSVRQGLLGLFEYLGFNPPHPRLGDLHANDEVTRSRNRSNSVRLLEETRRALKDYGYSLSSAQPGEIWTKARDAHVPSKVWVSLVRFSGSLDVGLSCSTKKVAEALTRLLPLDLKLLHREACDISFRETMQKDEACRYSVDTRVPLVAVLGSGDNGGIPRAIADTVMSLVKAAEPVKGFETRGERGLLSRRPRRGRGAWGD